jgi:hypothetical protein
MVLGHEITGEVIECGSGGEYIQKGYLVTVPFNVACGRCSTCRRPVSASMSIPVVQAEPTGMSHGRITLCRFQLDQVLGQGAGDVQDHGFDDALRYLAHGLPRCSRRRGWRRLDRLWLFPLISVGRISIWSDDRSFKTTPCSIFLPFGACHLRKVDRLNFYLVRTEIYQSTIFRHDDTLLSNYRYVYVLIVWVSYEFGNAEF